MTRLERKEAELEKLYEYRTAARKQNNLYWLQKNQPKIEALEREIIEMRRHRTESLHDAFADKDEDVKNRFYVALIRISMLSDAVYEACEEARDLMKKELNAVDFSLRSEVDELATLSRRMASFVCGTGSRLLEDCIVDDGKFVDCCMKLATKHITSKLKIKLK